MQLLKMLLVIFSLYNSFSLFAAKTKVVSSTNFSQARGWPDSFWLRDLEVAVEENLKRSIAVAKRQQVSPPLKEVKRAISQIFDQRVKDLEAVESQLEYTGFECLSEFESETRGLQDWLFFLSKTIKIFEPKILHIIDQQYALVEDVRFWLAKPSRMMIDVRRCFVDMFSSLTQAWSKELPDLICCQTNPNHAEMMDKLGETKKINVSQFFNKELTVYKQKMDLIVAQDFRDAQRPESIKARKDFYNLVIQLSQQLRCLEITDLCSLSNEKYNELYSLIEQIANIIINRSKQLKYDQKDFGFYVKKNLWIIMYWFYNIFPYKNFPWEDENFLKIENLFRQVSCLLDLDAPYVFKFNNTNRYKFKSAGKERKERVNTKTNAF